MPSMADFIHQYNRRHTRANEATGKVVSVRKPFAWVKVNGSGQLQEAWFNKSMVLSPGDDVQLIRTARNPRWVIQSAFQGIDEASPVGNDGITGPPGTDGTDGVDAVVGNIVSTSGNFLSVTSDTFQTVTSVTLTTTVGYPLVIFSGELIQQGLPSSPTRHVLALNYGSGDVEQVDTHIWEINGARMNAGFTFVGQGFAPGTYTFYLKARNYDAGRNLGVNVRRFLAAEV